MAQITDLISTEVLNTDDIAFLRQGTTDKSIPLELSSTLAWAKRNGYSRLGDHTSGSTFPSTEIFTTYQGKVYFVKVGVPLPYTSVATVPSSDSNLIDTPPKGFRSVVDNIYGIGAALLRFDDTDPNVQYPWQSWSLITGDASLALGDGSILSGTATGNNNPVVPVTEHSHGKGTLSAEQAAHTHSSGSISANQGSHTHSITGLTADQSAHTHSISGITATQASHTHTNELGYQVDGQPDTSDYPARSTNDPTVVELSEPTSSVAPSITLSGTLGSADPTINVGGSLGSADPVISVSGTTGSNQPFITVSGSTANSGTAGATLDVRGAQIKVNLWQRTA